MCKEYRQSLDLAKDNPPGLEALRTPNSFSSNPGFFGPAQRPATRPQQAVVGSGNTMGRSAVRGFGSVSNPAPGSVDPTADMGPQTMTSGYSG
jgi:hypothetical protein